LAKKQDITGLPRADSGCQNSNPGRSDDRQADDAELLRRRNFIWQCPRHVRPATSQVHCWKSGECPNSERPAMGTSGTAVSARLVPQAI